jgi:hypothetical protein
MTKTSNPDATVARRDTTFPSKNAGFLDTSQIDVGVGVGFDSSFALAIALRANIRHMQIGEADQIVVEGSIGQKRSIAPTIAILLLRGCNVDVTSR